MHYSYCDFKEGEGVILSVEAHLTIEQDYVTPVHFDGVNLIVGTNKRNVKATLEGINNRLKKIESLIGNK